MLPLGYTINQSYHTKITGFARHQNDAHAGKLILEEGESSCLTIAPTGSGKSRSAIIPSVLTYNDGTLIVFDIKGGEITAVTAKAREKVSEVIVIDPFHVTKRAGGTFNIMDIALDGKDIDQAGIMLAQAFQGPGASIKSDVFWDNSAMHLLGAATIYELSQERNFANIRKLLFADDVVYSVATLLDSKKVTSPLAHELFSSFLNVNAEVTRSGILATAQQYISLLGDPSVVNSLSGKSSFNVRDVLEGRPLSLFFIISPSKLAAYSTLIRLWITSLLYLITERQSRPASKTLMIIDECSAIGHISNLSTAVSIGRSYGLRLWPFFQSLGQLKALYPNEWVTIIDNMEVIQIFGIKTFMAAKELSDILGQITPHQILNLPSDQAILLRGGHKIGKVKKLDYLTDKMFKKSGYEGNPFYKNEKIK